MRDMLQREVTKYGQMIEGSDIERREFGYVTTKIYKYQNQYYVELWYNGYCIYFSEMKK